ncbi:hypothetical protein IV63_GL000141 [Companilactobacillus crustorum]|uniref:Uncharacterized protein n=2 Tax=Companilactobacillus TaxID=2767879 RepID=A0ABR5QHV0_9LACO|nr:hypothetical protein IV63_GL000141 [Companilactobacillus crustorum]
MSKKEALLVMSMNEFAHHIIAVANDNNLSITNLQLQKVMYFSLKEAMKENILNHKVDCKFNPNFWTNLSA